ncbi:MAG: methionine synthase [Candidatus Nanopelagicales bacterium]
MRVLPWKASRGTGVGSLPGIDSRESARLIAGECPEFIHLHELPARGPGADMIGRTGGMLSAVSQEFSIETTPRGWRFVPNAGRDTRRAQSFLNEDLDALEDVTQGYSGPLTLQVAGPWTLAAVIELASGERALKDPSACRDIASALQEALRHQIDQVRRRVPRASIVVQVDEPALTQVLEGSIGTASGLSAYNAIDEQVASPILAGVMSAIIDAGATAGIHCCAAQPPIELLVKTGADFVGLDLLRDFDEDELGAAWEGGIGLLAGTVPAIGQGAMSDTRASAPVRELASRLGLGDAQYLSQVVVTPTCGMAGASPQWVRSAYDSVKAAARVLRGDEEGDRDER